MRVVTGEHAMFRARLGSVGDPVSDAWAQCSSANLRNPCRAVIMAIGGSHTRIDCHPVSGLAPGQLDVVRVPACASASSSDVLDEYCEQAQARVMMQDRGRVIARVGVRLADGVKTALDRGLRRRFRATSG